MRLHRFYIEEKIDQKQEITLTNHDLINQLSNVFRFGIGDQVILFDGSGFEYECEILSLNKKEVKLKINPFVKTQDKDVLNSQGDSLNFKKVSLYLSLIKKANFELATEKCTEVGVSEIHPIISERSEKKDLNLERLNKIVKEASEQSGRLTLPKVFEITDLEKAVSQAISEGKACITFHTDIISNDYLDNHDSDVAVFVGPEGGWTEKEMELFKQNNFKILSLGQNILRAETAAMVAVWSQTKTQ